MLQTTNSLRVHIEICTRNFFILTQAALLSDAIKSMFFYVDLITGVSSPRLYRIARDILVRAGCLGLRDNLAAG